MAATAEKLEATLKELKSTAKSCQWSIDELHRVADREREGENTDFWMFVLMAGIMGVVGGLLGNFFPGDYRANPRCPRVLVGKLMQILALPVCLSEAYGKIERLCDFKPCHLDSVCPLQGRIENKAPSDTIKQLVAIAANLSGESLTSRGLVA